MFKRENLPNWVCAGLCAWQIVEQNIWRREDLKQPLPSPHELQFWLSNALLIAAVVFSVWYSHRNKGTSAPRPESPDNGIIEEVRNKLKTEETAHLRTAEILRGEAETQTKLFKDTHAKYLEAVDENHKLRMSLRDATTANTAKTMGVGAPSIIQGPAPQVEILSPMDHCEVGLNCTVSGRVTPPNHPVQVLVYGRDTQIFYLQGDAEVSDQTWSKKCQFGNAGKIGESYEIIAVCGKNIKEPRSQWLPDWLVKSKPVLDVRRTS